MAHCSCQNQHPHNPRDSPPEVKERFHPLLSSELSHGGVWPVFPQDYGRRQPCGVCCPAWGGLGASIPQHGLVPSEGGSVLPTVCCLLTHGGH